MMTKMVINPNRKLSRINRQIYGHFSEHLGRCIYEGIYVGENSPIENVNGMRTDVVEALKEIRVPVLRWPGGCFADEYHWMDGIGPAGSRKKMINTNWGGVLEDNSFGTHEYFELCRQLGCQTYINGNLGSGTVREMSEWIEYMTFDGISPMSELRGKNGQQAPWKVDYFGIGNENWGCGGNMNPDYYANEYRRYQSFVRDYNNEDHIQKICCGAPHEDYEWTKEVLATCFRRTSEEQHGFMDGLSLHYYVYPEGIEIKGSSTEFDENVWYKTLNKAVYIDELIRRHGKIMDEYDPLKKIGMIVDEWGTWYTCEPGTNPGFLYQQNTMRDVISGMLILHVFHKHNDRVKMANIAQMVNVLQAMILTDGEKMVLTPTYHLFRMMKGHMDGERVDVDYDCEEQEINGLKFPKISISASKKNGEMTVSICNTSLDSDEDMELDLRDSEFSVADGEILVSEHMNDCNTFDAPNTVEPKKFDVSLENGKLSFKLPKMSACVITLK